MLGDMDSKTVCDRIETTKKKSVIIATTFDFIIALTSPYTVSEEVPVISMSFDVTNNLGAGFNASGSTQNGVPNNRCYYWVEDPSPSITIQ